MPLSLLKLANPARLIKTITSRPRACQVPVQPSFLAQRAAKTSRRATLWLCNRLADFGIAASAQCGAMDPARESFVLWQTVEVDGENIIQRLQYIGEQPGARDPDAGS